MAKMEDKVFSVFKGQKKIPITLKELARKAGIKKKEREIFLTLIDSLKVQNLLILYVRQCIFLH